MTLKRTCAGLDIPSLETERLLLRAFTADDVAPLAAIHGDERTMQFLGGQTDPTLLGANDKILSYLGHWALNGFGRWAVQEKASGRMIGRTGFLDAPDEWPGNELGWTFLRETWGNGYATEAATAARDFGFREIGMERVISMIHPDNTPSQAVAKRLGESPWKPFTFKGSENMLWSITREQWLRRAGA
jgi:RimJ/RimL family protein N-acetyltransferase